MNFSLFIRLKHFLRQKFFCSVFKNLTGQGIWIFVPQFGAASKRRWVSEAPPPLGACGRPRDLLTSRLWRKSMTHPFCMTARSGGTGTVPTIAHHRGHRETNNRTLCLLSFTVSISTWELAVTKTFPTEVQSLSAISHHFSFLCCCSVVSLYVVGMVCERKALRVLRRSLVCCGHRMVYR